MGTTHMDVTHGYPWVYASPSHGSVFVLVEDGLQVHAYATIFFPQLILGLLPLWIHD